MFRLYWHIDTLPSLYYWLWHYDYEAITQFRAMSYAQSFPARAWRTALTYLDLAGSLFKTTARIFKNSDVYRHDVSTQCGNIDNLELTTCMAQSGAKQFIVRGAQTRHRRFLVVASLSGFMPSRPTMPPTGLAAGITQNHDLPLHNLCHIPESLGHNLSIGTMIFSWKYYNLICNPWKYPPSFPMP